MVDVLNGIIDPARLGREPLAAPHLMDSAVMHVLRGKVMRGALSEEQGAGAVDAFLRLVIARYPAEPLRPRMWELRHNLTAYDATYVALAERVGATALLTTDARLASAPGLRCAIELLR
ncbi:type II toxin-antitoxin system VapC family toxin [Agrococcus sp. ARC_14]|nr:type II toxin-antitoxin system VapC family toxin [Agrococcus sp. ARC_14]